MGMHFVNMNLVGDGAIDATRPEIVIYEPQPDGGLRLIGADYLVFADTWDATHSSAPELMGQLFHRFDAPNRFGLPGVLHAARVGVEGQPHRDVRELERERVLRRVFRPAALSVVLPRGSRGSRGSKVQEFMGSEPSTRDRRAAA